MKPKITNETFSTMYLIPKELYHKFIEKIDSVHDKNTLSDINEDKLSSVLRNNESKDDNNGDQDENIASSANSASANDVSSIAENSTEDRKMENSNISDSDKPNDILDCEKKNMLSDKDNNININIENDTKSKEVDKKYLCKICKKMFTSKWTLKRHSQSMHKETVDVENKDVSNNRKSEIQTANNENKKLPTLNETKISSKLNETPSTKKPRFLTRRPLKKDNIVNNKPMNDPIKSRFTRKRKREDDSTITPKDKKLKYEKWK